MTWYRKRPLAVRAYQWSGKLIEDPEFMDVVCNDNDSPLGTGYHIHTLEGDFVIKPGDWIIRGIEGEFWPVKNSIFLSTYEQIEDPKPGEGYF